MAEHTKSYSEQQLVVFKLADEEFGVNINDVREIIRAGAITRMPNTAEYIRGVINLRGSIIVVIDLAMKLGLPSGLFDKNTRIIVIEVEKNTVGMIVDSATEVLHLTSDQIQPAPAVITEKINAQYLAGVGIVGERLLILLNLNAVLAEQDTKAIVQARSSATIPEPKARPEPMKEEQKAPPKAEEKPEPVDPSEHPALKDVHESFRFITHDGKPLKNVSELLFYIHSLDESTFRAFVNEEKNDFYNWIKYAVKDDDLATSIQRVKTKEDVTKEIRDRILRIHLDAA